MPEGHVLEFTRVTKRFNDVTAVSDFSARVEPGVVTAFLGPNGAGKTTTLRMLLGQIRPTSGTATIGGVAYADLRTPLKTIGSVLEETVYRPRRTATRQLTIAAKANGIPLSRVDEVLALVGLDGEGEGRIGSFSLGMRQRLSVAHALLGDAGTLVFDEPANGLDPEGIRWMRLLMRRLADEGRTVLVSSHVLSEVEQVADHVLVLSKGQLVLSSGIESLADPASGSVVVDAADRSAISDALTGAGFEVEVLRSGLTVRGGDAKTVGSVAAAAGIALSTLVQRGPTLEDVFIDLVRGGKLVPTPASVSVAVEDEAAAGDLGAGAAAGVVEATAGAGVPVDAGTAGDAGTGAVGETDAVVEVVEEADADEDTAVAEAVAEEAPVAEAPVVEALVAEAPVEDASIEDASIEEARVEEAPVADAAVEEAPAAEEAASEDAPAEEAPAEDAPADEAPAPSFDDILFGARDDTPAEPSVFDAPQDADDHVGTAIFDALTEASASHSETVNEESPADDIAVEDEPAESDGAESGSDEHDEHDDETAEQADDEVADETEPGENAGDETVDDAERIVAEEAVEDDSAAPAEEAAEADAEDGHTDGGEPATDGAGQEDFEADAETHDADAPEHSASDDHESGTEHESESDPTPAQDEDPRSAAVSSMLAEAARAYYEDEPRDYPFGDAAVGSEDEHDEAPASDDASDEPSEPEQHHHY